MDRLDVPNQLSLVDTRNETDIEKIYKEANVDYVRKEGNLNKQVRYACPLCVLNGAQTSAYTVHFSLDFYRDPSDKNYDPDYDPCLERGSKLYYHYGKYRLPIPPGKMKTEKDEKVRKNALWK